VKRPAFMFYPADWRKDPTLRVCSIAARGLWIDMLALMHESDPYGHLVVNGEPVSVAQLARLIGESAALVKKLLAELESRNVFSRTDSGVIFSRRMVRDEHIREVRAEAGKLGGNPALLDKGKRGSKDKGLLKQTDKQIPTPSVAVAVAPSGEVQKQEPKGAVKPRVPNERPPRQPAPWMGRMRQAWTFGGLLAGDATLLAQVVRDVGEDEAVERLENFCATADPEFSTIRTFVSKHATYASKGRPAVDPVTGLPNAIGMAALSGRR
jgi:hypothetical protein